jgi:protein SCO1/2
VLKDFLGNFDNRIIGLTGSAKAIKSFAKSFGTTFSRRAARSDARYEMDHATIAFLKDRQWKGAGAVFMGDGSDIPFILRRFISLLDG